MASPSLIFTLRLLLGCSEQRRCGSTALVTSQHGTAADPERDEKEDPAVDRQQLDPSALLQHRQHLQGDQLATHAEVKVPSLRRDMVAG